jgi:Eco57I restriction-modification methylase/restriction endonuclease TaqI-like protein
LNREIVDQLLKRIGNSTLEQFIRRHDLAEMTPEKLATIYERSLDGVRDRKAGGVFYTPQYIVDFLVHNTVGKLLDGKTPKEAADLKIVDPACGAGVFLLGAYQHLLDWHLAWYSMHCPRNAALRADSRGHFRLALQERIRILLDNVFGVDVDGQAVEITRLSLLLKALDDESAESHGLPDLSGNIKCGNSLVGPDFGDPVHGINAFDWHVQFEKVFQNGGFDAVIGNPPFIRMETFKTLKDYLKRNYSCHDERSDLYAYFIERGHRILKPGGRFGMIVSNKFVRANYGEPLRKFLGESSYVETIADFAGLPVFPGATVRTLAFISLHGVKPRKTTYAPPPSIDRFAAIRSGKLTVQDNVDQTGYDVARLCGRQSEWKFSPNGVNALLSKLQTGRRTLREYCQGPPCRGVVSGLTDAFVIDEAARRSILRRNPEAREILKPFLNGRDVRRYRIEPPGLYLIYTFHGVEIRRYPAVERHLKPFKPQLEKRATRQNWYELQQPQLRFARLMEEPKIVFPDMATEPRFALDDSGHYGSNTIYFLPKRDLFLLGLLNSRVSFFYFRQKCAGLESKTETYLRFFGQYLEGFPIAQADAAQRGNLISLIDSMLSLQTSAPTADRRIDDTSCRIDRLVYDLYGLGDDEIELVENTTNSARGPSPRLILPSANGRMECPV